MWTDCALGRNPGGVWRMGQKELMETACWSPKALMIIPYIWVRLCNLQYSLTPFSKLNPHHSKRQQLDTGFQRKWACKWSIMQRKHRQPDPHLKSTVRIPTGCSCQEAPRHFMFIIGSVLSYSLNISVLSSFLKARGLLMLYSYWNKLTVICRNGSLQATRTPAPQPPIAAPKENKWSTVVWTGLFSIPWDLF